MGVSIKKAVPSECGEVYSIYEAVCADFSAKINYQGWDINRYPTRQTAADGIARGDLFIARVCETVAGTMVLNSFQSPEYAEIAWGQKARDDEVLCIHTFCVAPDFRGMGVAKAMLEYVVRYAKQAGAATMRLDTSSINAASQSLYEAAGFVRRGSVDLGLHDIFGIKWYYCYDKKVE